MTEPPNTEALLATVQEALSEYAARLRDTAPERRALPALDAIASELERLTTERQEQVRLSGERAALLTRYSQRAEAAEAELERLKGLLQDNRRLALGAALDDVQRELKRVRAERDDSRQARLDRAVEALRGADALLDSVYAKGEKHADDLLRVRTQVKCCPGRDRGARVMFWVVLAAGIVLMLLFVALAVVEYQG